jgi:hypothetical protein
MFPFYLRHNRKLDVAIKIHNRLIAVNKFKVEMWITTSVKLYWICDFESERIVKEKNTKVSYRHDIHDIHSLY